MRTHRLEHLSDASLLRELTALVAEERTAMATVWAHVAAGLAHIAEVVARRLYLGAGFPSMQSYCVEELRFSPVVAFKRIQAARAARKSPAFFAAVAEGKLHLTGVLKLAPHVTDQNAEELITAAAGKSRLEIERLIALRFHPQPLLLAQASAPAAEQERDPDPVLSPHQRDPEPVSLQQRDLDPVVTLEVKKAVGTPVFVTPSATPPASPSPPTPRLFDLHMRVDQDTRDMLTHAQNLLGRSVRYGDVASVFARALKALIGQIERRKFAATSRPLRVARGSENPRTIPARVRRAVRERDGDQCAFVSESGRRCTSRGDLQFDHVEPVALGGRSTVENVRLLCPAHNQLEAERVFGGGFMQAKREQAHRAPATAGARDGEIARLRADSTPRHCLG